MTVGIREIERSAEAGGLSGGKIKGVKWKVKETGEMRRSWSVFLFVFLHSTSVKKCR